MKRIKKSFTLVEMMMVLGIIAILFGIGTAVFTVATGKSEIASAKSQIAQLTAAVEMYYDRWGQYPVPSGQVIDDVNDALNFGEWLAKIAPNNPIYQNPSASEPQYRKMFLNFNGYDISNPEYAHYDSDENEGSIIYDPWGTPYGYTYNASTQSFIVYSVGTYEVNGDLSASWVSNAWQFTDTGGTYTSEKASDLGIVSSHMK